jgi:hypothetical protein
VAGGAHVNPDQFHGGAFYEFPALADRLTLRPSGGVGMGNGATLVFGNFDVLYDLRLWRRSPWAASVGGGPAINHYRLDLYSETEAGVTALGGLAHPSGWFTELRVDFLDSPRMTASVGYSFRLSARQRRRRGGP